MFFVFLFERADPRGSETFRRARFSINASHDAPPRAVVTRRSSRVVVGSLDKLEGAWADFFTGLTHSRSGGNVELFPTRL